MDFSPKLLIVFRGGYERVPDTEFVCENIKEYIFKPLSNNNIKYDVVFSTYNNDSQKLLIYKKNLMPINIFFTQNGQIINFKETLKNVKSLSSYYNHVILLRFEAIYKISIFEWDFFNKNGVILPFKEDNEELFNKTGWYNDNIIIVSGIYFNKFCDIIYNAPYESFTPEHTLHNIVNIIHNSDKTIPVYCLISGYFQANNPNFVQDDKKLSPIYVLVHYPYHGKDKQLIGLY